MRIALLPGSYDPMTLGHKDIILRAMKLYDKVYVAILHNEDKKGRFSYEERLKIAELTLKNTDAEIIVSDGYTADLARKLGACALVKGIRNSKDFEYEKAGEDFNLRRFPECETVYLRSRDEYAAVSSTEAYERLKNHADTSGFIEPDAEKYIREIMK